jgi:hypothetical protein
LSLCSSIHHAALAFLFAPAFIMQHLLFSLPQHSSCSTCFSLCSSIHHAALAFLFAPAFIMQHLLFSLLQHSSCSTCFCLCSSIHLAALAFLFAPIHRTTLFRPLHDTVADFSFNLAPNRLMLVLMQLLRVQCVHQPHRFLRGERFWKHSSNSKACFFPALPSSPSPTVQMMAMGGLLAANGFKFWDLGMELPYKIAFGCHSIPRAQFHSRLQLSRKCSAAASLPRQLWESASVSIARASQKHVCVQVPIDSCVSIAEVKEAVLELRARGAAAERIQEAMTRIKQMQAASKQLVGELQQNAES